MDGKDEKLLRALNKEKEEEYPCVWYSRISCPIRSRWKLLPENLTPWCTVCKQIGFLDEEKQKLEGKEEEK